MTISGGRGNRGNGGARTNRGDLKSRPKNAMEEIATTRSDIGQRSYNLNQKYVFFFQGLPD